VKQFIIILAFSKIATSNIQRFIK